MSKEHTEQEKEMMREEDSKLDAIAAVVIILSLVAIAVFWGFKSIIINKDKYGRCKFFKR
jgi:hypothetical protein